MRRLLEGVVSAAQEGFLDWLVGETVSKTLAGSVVMLNQGGLARVVSNLLHQN